MSDLDEKAAAASSDTQTDKPVKRLDQARVYLRSGKPLPSNITAHPQVDGRTLYEHIGYKGVLVDMDQVDLSVDLSDEAIKGASEEQINYLCAVMHIIFDLVDPKGPLVWRFEEEASPQTVPRSVAATPIDPVPEKKKWEGGVRRRFAEVPTAYVHVGTGETVFRDQQMILPKQPSLAQIIDALPPDVRRVYLVGPKPGRGGSAETLYQWFRQKEVGESWEVTKFLQDDDLPLLDLVARGEGRGRRTLRVQRMAQWFDDDVDYSPRQARDAMVYLDQLLQRSFDENARCLNTPGATGQALWDRLRKASYPQLSEEDQRLIRSTSGQGRFELCSLPAREQLLGFAYLDGRFMYAALCTGLGFGPAERDTLNEYDPHRRGRYRISFRVPRDWDHVGLLPVKDEDGETWLYPSERGYQGETWADAVEVGLALERGWSIEIRERLLLQSSTAGQPWPLDTWAKRLIDMRAEVIASRDRREIDPFLAELVAQGLRAILLHTIGAFHRRDSFETVIVYGQADLRRVPAQYPVTAHGDGTWTYRHPAALSKWAAQFQHPEFSAAVWARCRRRLLLSETKKKGVVVEQAGVLTLPRVKLVGMRVDAMYLTENPGWKDTGEPGKFRLKGLLKEPVSQPVNYEELNMLRDRSVVALRKQQQKR